MQIEGRNAVLEALKKEIPLDVIYVSKDSKEGSIRKIISMAKEKKIILKQTDRMKLEQMTETGAHQGVIALTMDYAYSTVEEILASVKMQNKTGFLLILDEIEDPHNLGALIRSAEGAGVDGVILPKRRSATVNATVEKTSAGAVSYMKVARVRNISQTIELLKKENYWVYGLDMDGTEYTQNDWSGNIAIVVGNEGKGMGRLVRQHCDKILSIPMKGQIQSLNASVAGSVILFEASKQRGTK